MTDAELDADIERMLAVHRNRKTLGFSYFETSRPKGKTDYRRPRPPRPKREEKIVKGVERWEENADMLEMVLAMAVSGLIIRQACAERAPVPLGTGAHAQTTTDHHSRTRDDNRSACGANGGAG